MPYATETMAQISLPDLVTGYKVVFCFILVYMFIFIMNKNKEKYQIATRVKLNPNISNYVTLFALNACFIKTNQSKPKQKRRQTNKQKKKRSKQTILSLCSMQFQN